ncbi:hypothetical protein ACVBEH_18220 [Roseateles sp. GG27B]
MHPNQGSNPQQAGRPWPVTGQIREHTRQAGVADAMALQMLASTWRMVVTASRGRRPAPCPPRPLAQRARRTATHTHMTLPRPWSVPWLPF